MNTCGVSIPFLLFCLNVTAAKGRGYTELFKKLAAIHASFFGGYSGAKRNEKVLKIEVFSRYPPVFQKDFSDMHDVKQTQIKFIIVNFAFKKTLFPR